MTPWPLTASLGAILDADHCGVADDVTSAELDVLTASLAAGREHGWYDPSPFSGTRRGLQLELRILLPGEAGCHEDDGLRRRGDLGKNVDPSVLEGTGIIAGSPVYERIRLPDALLALDVARQRQPAGDYGVQVAVAQLDGARRAAIKAFCDDHGIDTAEQPVIVLDGGDCYWPAVVDLDQAAIVSSTVNGGR